MQKSVHPHQFVKFSSEFLIFLFKCLLVNVILHFVIVIHTTCTPHVDDLKLTLDHADIIGSVSYGQGDSSLVPLHQLHHLSFLHRCDPAADHCFT